MGMRIDDFISLANNNQEALAPLFETNFQGEFNHTLVSDIFAKHIGFDKAPGKISDELLDQMVVSRSAFEITRGAGSEEVARSFIFGTSGFGSYDEGGPGHYFAFETLDQESVDKLGLGFDATKRGGAGPSLTYQATHYVQSDEGSPMIRAGLPADSKITTRKKLFDEIDNLQEGKAGILTDFRKQLVESNNSKSLNLFDNIFSTNVKGELSSGIAAMIMGYDAATVADTDNEIRVFNRAKIVVTPLKTVKEMDDLYPRTAPALKGGVMKGKYIESAAERFSLVQQRVAKSVGKSSAGRSFFDDAVKSASGSKVIKAAGRAIKSIT